MTKKDIRANIRTLKKNVSDEELMASSLIVAKKVIDLEEYKKADVIFAYIATNQEIKTDAIILDALQKGKKVAAPKCFGKIMEFFFFESIDDLKLGAFDILEPDEKYPVTSEIKNVFMLVPGMAFDKNKNRIGYGGGYYDRYFDTHKDIKIYKCALCHGFQLIDEIETEEHDQKVDIIVSNK